MRFHLVKTDRFDRTGRAKRGTDTTAKKYNLTYCGRELTDRELESYGEDCKTCAAASEREYEREEASTSTAY